MTMSLVDLICTEKSGSKHRKEKCGVPRTPEKPPDFSVCQCGHISNSIYQDRVHTLFCDYLAQATNQLGICVCANAISKRNRSGSTVLVAAKLRESHFSVQWYARFHTTTMPRMTKQLHARCDEEIRKRHGLTRVKEILLPCTVRNFLQTEDD